MYTKGKVTPCWAFPSFTISRAGYALRWKLATHLLCTQSRQFVEKNLAGPLQIPYFEHFDNVLLALDPQRLVTDINGIYIATAAYPVNPLLPPHRHRHFKPTFAGWLETADNPRDFFATRYSLVTSPFRLTRILTYRPFLTLQ